MGKTSLFSHCLVVQGDIVFFPSLETFHVKVTGSTFDKSTFFFPSQENYFRHLNVKMKDTNQLYKLTNLLLTSKEDKQKSFYYLL